MVSLQTKLTANITCSRLKVFFKITKYFMIKEFVLQEYYANCWSFLLNNDYRYLCISSVYYLTSECSSLTVTLVITLRKFVSLLFSIVYFKNPFTLWHWIGTGLVFSGTLIFTEVPQKIMQTTAKAPSEKIKKKQ